MGNANKRFSTMMHFKVIIISAFALLLLGGQNASAECPDPWTDLGYLGCFHFAEESDFVNWYAAQHYCNDLDENAFLAEILDEETQLVLTALADELPDIGWWLGATDFYQEGVWRWMKSGKMMEYSAWAPGEPNNEYLPGSSEECLHLRRNADVVGRLWNDLPCLSNELADRFKSKPLCQLF